MKKIYKGKMRRLIVSNIDVTDKAITLLEYDTPVVEKDLLFYYSRLGALISFDYDTRLPDFAEASDYIKDTIAHMGYITTPPFPSCPYVDEGDVKFFHEIGDRDFKSLKKRFREIHKKRSK